MEFLHNVLVILHIIVDWGIAFLSGISIIIIWKSPALKNKSTFVQRSAVFVLLFFTFVIILNFTDNPTWKSEILHFSIFIKWCWVYYFHITEISAWESSLLKNLIEKCKMLIKRRTRKND